MQGPPLNLSRCNLTDNTATGGQGGAIYSSSVNVTVVDFTLVRNNSASQEGGALYTTGSPLLTVADTTMSSNSAGAAGGALYVDASVNVQGDRLTLAAHNITAVGNQATSGQAGAFFLKSVRGSLLFDASKAIKNRAATSVKVEEQLQLMALVHTNR
ncbi:hypothetical protein TSOC_001130 [Tetrabaena socialis]|uniref:Right handed beta helix domain-containing protein n=1 Tax=Tetrabaena socialis TaxID=47790 RepID=A0A2J8AHJ0_9CHLO|nr:hypothetical protein TSOC_001130 [Tetrabaena socialis]|eukprot:PNH11979.1 hypothetical protein TSOC_001130 [Tetrabaena socialis]